MLMTETGLGMPMRFCTIFLLFTLLLPQMAHAAEKPAFSEEFSEEILQLGELLNNSQYQQVFDLGEPLLARVQTAIPAGSYDEAKILGFLVHAHYRSRRVMEPVALERGNRGIQMMEQKLGPDHPELAVSYMHLGNLYNRRWEGAKAIPNFQRALEILAQAGPDYDDQRAIILTSNGVAFRRTGDNKTAMALYDEALAIQERLLGPDHPNIASTLNNQASILSEYGDYSASADRHRRALAIREKALGPDHEWVGESTYNLANQMAYLGYYDEALALGERTLAIFEKKLGTEHPRYWLTVQNLGQTYLDMGDYERAALELERALEGLEKVYGRRSTQLCYTLDALAQSRFSMGEIEPALDLYNESLAIAVEAYGEGANQTADTISQQGKCMIALGRTDEALERLNLSLSIWRDYLGEDNVLICGILEQLADLHLLRDEPDQALEFATLSGNLVRDELGEKHPFLAKALLLQARAQRNLGNTNQALDLALQAETISREHLLQTMPVLSESLALDYAGSRVDGLDVALCTLKDGETGPRVFRAWDAVVRSRSLVLDQYTMRNRVLNQEENPESAALRDSSRALRERLANLTLRGPGWEEISVYQELIQETERDLQDIERQLSLFHTEKDDKTGPGTAGLDQVRKALPEGAALVAFKQCADESGDHFYKAFVLGGDEKEPVVRDLGEAELVDSAVEAWRDQATFGIRRVEANHSGDEANVASRGFVKVGRNEGAQLKSYLEAGSALRQLTWDPLLDDLDGSKTVFVVAEGSLNLVGFPSLPGSGGRFLVEDGPLFHLLTSEKSLIREDLPGRESGLLLALGGADFAPPREFSGPDRNSDLTLRKAQFSSLPHALREVENIAGSWENSGRPVTLLTGLEATESRLKSELPSAQVLHLATHGFFLPKDKNEDKLSSWDNPLVRSGLALAGANRWQDSPGANDGILTAQEVAGLDLSSVQWAVLSACDTGLGDLDSRGEGVFGLRRAFALAGAGTVIMSLWEVDDAASSQWMVALYRARWEEGKTTAEAVRQASLEVLEQRRDEGLSTHPHYWAGFVAAGDWR